MLHWQMPPDKWSRQSPARGSWTSRACNHRCLDVCKEGNQVTCAGAVRPLETPKPYANPLGLGRLSCTATRRSEAQVVDSHSTVIGHTCKPLSSGTVTKLVKNRNLGPRS